MGLHAELVAELSVLSAEYPLREGFCAQSMLALYRSGRQAEALHAYQKTRSYLVEELGLDASTKLRELEHRILNHDSSLFLEIEPRVETLAFLLTDIENSTVLWELQTEQMRSALERHDEVVFGAIEAVGGRIVKRVGDGVDIAFADVGAAVAAAEEIQRSLAAGEMLEAGALAVRMAIDVGEVEGRRGDYFGPVLNRAGRMLAAAHGGQVLLSGDAHAALAASESGWQAKALGEVRFKGIGSPVTVFQLLPDGLPRDFPPLRIDRLPPEPPAVAFGRSVRGYELREEIGSGDFGIVYRAYQPSMGREVAIKIIRPDLVNQPSFVRSFESEARFVAQLEHPHIVSLYDYWRDPDGAYLVMRWLRSGSLREALERGPWNLEPAGRLLAQVGGALSYAHRQGVVHGDLKPANVLLDEEGNAYLSDFGIAARLDDHQETAPVPTSSPAYVPPEELEGHTRTSRSDLYNLGLLTYELMTGRRPPMDGGLPAVKSVRPELPAALDRAIAKATAVDPRDRYASVDEFLAASGLAPGAAAPRLETSYTVAENPYKGLRAFEETDAEDFYGRESLVSELISAVGEHRLVAIVGPSGIGKSSVVKAGLVPALRRGVLAGSQIWLISDMFPGSYPYEELTAALLRVAIDRPNDLTEELGRDELGVRRVAKRILPPDTELLLVIDQFEELFTLTADNDVRKRFLDALTQLGADSRSRVRVLLTIRADFLDQPLRHPEFGELVKAGMVAVTSPSDDDLAAAIERPAQSVGVRFEPGLVSQIITDVRDQPGALPLLQYALTELFAARSSDLLTADAYRATGGVVGALGRRAEELWNRLDPSGQAAARQIFLRLVSVDAGGQSTRRRVRRLELRHLDLDPAVLEEIIRRFGEYRLLTFDRDPITRSPTVEVAHEALLVQWGRLRTWVDERREDLVLYRRLREAASEWEDSGRLTDYLPRHGRLAQFESWAGTTDLALSSEEREFVDAARAEAESVTTRQRRANRRLRILLAGTATLLLLTLLAGAVALKQRGHARHAATAALARQLGAEAVSEPRIDRAMLLAREAVNLDRSPQTEGTLLATLLRSPAAIGTFTGPIDSRPQRIDVSPDERTIAVADNTAAVRFYDPFGRRVRKVVNNLGYGFPPTYARDGSFFIAAGALHDRPVIDVRDARTYRVIRRLHYDHRWLTQPTGPSSTFVLTRDGRTAFMAYPLQKTTSSPGAGYVDRWDVASGRLVSTTPVGADGTFELRLVDGDRRLIVLGAGIVTFLDERTMRPVRKFRVPLSSTGFDQSVSPDGRTAAVQTTPGALSFVDLATGRVRPGVGAQATAISGLAFSPDSRTVATGGEDGSLVVWDVKTARTTERLTGHGGRILGIAFSDDGRTLFTSSLDGAIFEWDLASGRRFGRAFATSATPERPLLSDDASTDPPPLAVSPDGSRYAVRAHASQIALYGTEDGRKLAEWSPPIGPELTGLAWSRRGELALIGDAGRLQLWSTDGQPRLVRRLSGFRSITKEPEVVTSVAFSPDGNLLAAGDVNHTPFTVHYRYGTVAVWDPVSGRLLWKRRSRRGTVNAVSFSPDGATLAAGYENGVAVLYDAHSGRLLRTLRLQGGGDFSFETLAFSPRGLLATGTWAGIVQLWNPSTGTEIGRPTLVAAAPVASISFDPTGDTFATTGGSDGVAKLWRSSTLQQFGATFPGNPGQWGSAAYTPDGSRLVVSYQDGTGDVWPTSLAAWEQHACGVAGRSFTHEEWLRFIGSRSYAKTCG